MDNTTVNKNDKRLGIQCPMRRSLNLRINLESTLFLETLGKIKYGV